MVPIRRSRPPPLEGAAAQHVRERGDEEKSSQKRMGVDAKRPLEGFHL